MQINTANFVKEKKLNKENPKYSGEMQKNISKKESIFQNNLLSYLSFVIYFTINLENIPK